MILSPLRYQFRHPRAAKGSVFLLGLSDTLACARPCPLSESTPVGEFIKTHHSMKQGRPFAIVKDAPPTLKGLVHARCLRKWRDVMLALGRETDTRMRCHKPKCPLNAPPRSRGRFPSCLGRTFGWVAAGWNAVLMPRGGTQQR